MAKQSKKQRKQQYNRKSTVKKSGKRSSPTKTSVTNSNIKQAKDTAQSAAKKRKIVGDKLKNIGVVVVCAVMVLAFAIPTGIAALTAQNMNDAAEEAAKEEATTSISREAREALTATGKFDNFLVVDRANGLTAYDLYDPLVTPEEQQTLDRLAAEGTTAGDQVEINSLITTNDGDAAS